MAEQTPLSASPDRRGVLRRTWPHMRAHRRSIVIALITSAAATLTTVAVPAVIGAAVDHLLARERTGLLVSVALLIALALLRLLLFRRAEILLTAVGERVVRRLRNLAVERLSRAPLRFLEAQPSGDLLRRTTTEIADLANFVRAQLPELLTVGGYLTFTTVLLLGYSPLLTLVTLMAFVPAIIWVLRRFKKAAGPAFAAEAAAAGTVAATYRELVQSREMLVTGGGVGFWRERFGRNTDRRYRAARRSQRSLFIISLARLVQGVTTAALLLIGGRLAAEGRISVGTVVVFILASRQLFDSAAQASTLMGQLQLTLVGLARLLDLLARTAPGTSARGDSGTEPEPGAAPRTAPTRRAAVGPAAVTAERGVLEVEGVHYAYIPTTPVLSGLTLRIEPAERVGLVGPTGAGKTTLAKLLTGLYTPDSGIVRYDGRDLRDLPPDELRRRIVLIPQQVHLIHGTLLDNLGLVPGDPGEDRIRAAVRELRLTEWAEGLPGGLHTPLGGGAGGLSAGEVQLIGLVRAALVDPAVLVLDEASADVDPDTARRVETAIDTLRTDRTLIVIAHREATINRLPRIIGLDAGSVPAG
ncbi:ABC transporter ATP-binding protein [Streptomyces sp. NPDC001985]|uniref:ABC transporter ATP-binding protein n=1 Tax=Streptomyces sp. NPDC001985 TaxID=3154406 RepID=UPI00331C5AAC